jgi:thiol-disulfide isomerase/thioredoxin
VERTRTFGCSTKWAEKRADAQKSLEKWNAEPVLLERLDEAALTKLAANDTDKLLLVNVWATWCGPCLAELPEFVTMNRMYRGREFELVTISLDELDQESQALEALKDKKVATRNYLSAIADRDRLADLLDKEWAGPLPHTVLIAPGGKVLYRHTGGVEPLAVRRAIVDFLGRTYASREKAKPE